MSGGPLRIVLVNPPFQYFPNVNGKGKRLNYARPPLGIAYLAAYVRRYLDHPTEISLIDCPASEIFTEEDLENRLVALHPDVIGFSLVTATRDIAGRMAPRLKRRMPAVRILFGGPHVTALPAEEAPGVDALFLGEGEASLTEYLDRTVLKGADDPIQGCIRPGRDDPKTQARRRPLIEPLDRIPFPARDLLPMTAYVHSYPHRYRAFSTMFASRGCPFNCSFCGNEVLWQHHVRFHSPERVFEEIDHLAGRLGVDLVFFEDDTFLANRALALRIMHHIRSRHPGLKWMCHVRADMLDREILAEMDAANCVEMQIGVESGSQEILARADKSLRIEDVRRTFALLKRTRIKSWATYIIGNEGETEETVRETVRFALETDPSYASFIILLPFPGTRVYEVYKQRGYLRARSWADYSWHGNPVFETEQLTARDLKRLRAWAFRSFYLRPAKLWWILRDVVRAASLREIRRSFRFWLSLSF